MRRPESQPFRLIIPIHVARQLANVERSISAAIRNELQELAEQLGRTPPSWSEAKRRSLTVRGITVEYECDPRNGAVVALNLAGIF